jgi:hypothetical protein
VVTFSDNSDTHFSMEKSVCPDQNLTTQKPTFFTKTTQNPKQNRTHHKKPDQKPKQPHKHKQKQNQNNTVT